MYVCYMNNIWILFSPEKEEKSAFFNKVTLLQGIMLSEISQTEKAK